MANLSKSYETKLEIAKSENIIAILDAKLEATSPQQVTDYVSFAVDNLESKINRIKDAEIELKRIKSDAESQIEIIKIGVAQWLNESGVGKLDGDIVSSMKIVQPEEKTEVLITATEDTLINQGYFKTSIDKTAIKNALINDDVVDGAELRITHKQESITIYKKRK